MLLSIPFSNNGKAADSTSPRASIAALVAIGILFRVLVPLLAMCALSLLFPAVTASDVFNEGDRLKVVRIDTRADTAEMIQKESFWDVPTEQDIANPVGDGPLSTKAKFTVAALIAVGHPKPAASVWFWGNFIKEAVYDGLSHVTPSSRIGQAHQAAGIASWAVSILQHNFAVSAVS